MLDPLWSAATRHPFLDAVRDGTIADEAFDRWLAQDALFVADLLAFQARLLGRAPRHAQAVLAGGCVALVSELDWFEVMAA
ncbi:MAG TPA: TenA family transcriptional regulator, partial [Mycobacterium sp.]